MYPCRAFYECFFWFFSCLFAKNVGSLKIQISQKNLKIQISDEKKHSLKARQGHTKPMCKISGSNTQKRRGHWHLKEFWVLRLNNLYMADIISTSMVKGTSIVKIFCMANIISTVNITCMANILSMVLFKLTMANVL